MSATATVWSRDFAGTKKEIALSSARYCLAFSTTAALCSMLVFAPASATKNGQSRWSQGKDLSWEPLRPELVVEVAYDHMQGDRFRHTAQFRRWRKDKKPSDCTYDQLEVVPPQELAAIFPQGR